jgi:Protein of unknown function (DUF3107)
MEVKIGVQNIPREISIETNLDADAIEELVNKALTDGGVLAITDAKGRRVVVPAATLAYVDVSTSVSGQVGFRS